MFIEYGEIQSTSKQQVSDEPCDFFFSPMLARMYIMWANEMMIRLVFKHHE